MCNEWMPRLELQLTPTEFLHLPRNAAYRYTYHAGTAWLNPAPRFYHARLDLPGLRPDGPARVPVRPVRAGDWEALARVFTEAFAGQQPFAGLSADERRDAARRSLERTQRGGDGAYLGEASFLASSPRGEPTAAVLITLISPEMLADWGVDEPAERPHLTWVFVHPDDAGRGIGTALLTRSAQALLGLGHDVLYSTFLAGNDSSMLWHWRTGFRLLRHISSRRP